MRKQWIASLGVTVMAASLAFASGKKDIQKQITATSKAITEGCGCTVQFSYAKSLDFTAENGNSLAFNVEKTIESVGPEAVKWCKRDVEFKDKFCSMIKAIEVDQDKTAGTPYSTVVRPGVIRNVIATKSPGTISYDGGWLVHYLETGKMRERKTDD